MFELILLAAIAYAGARGVERVAGTTDRRHDSPSARRTVETVAASGPGRLEKKPPGPVEPGGTFSAAAPRSARIGGKAAVPLAVITETGSTMWKAVSEGYRERWPEIRAEHRRKMAEKSKTRRNKKDETKEKAEETDAASGPPPYPDYPPTPAEAEPGSGPGGTPAATVPEPRNPDEERAHAAEERAEAAEKKAEKALKEAEEARERAATDKVISAQKEAREAKEREAAAEERARTAEERVRAAEERTPDSGAPPEPPAERRHLSVVPDTAQNGDSVSSPMTVIPEIRTLDGLMNALTLIKAMCEMRSEEALAIAADDKDLANRLDQLEAELEDLEVDTKTTAEISALRESVATQSQAAAQYGGAAKDTGDFAVAAAAAAYKSHGGIAEAVQSSPIDKAAQGGYYSR